MAYTYTSLKTAIATMLPTEEGNAQFEELFPSAIIYSEQRIYRELNLLDTIVRATGAATIGSRSFTLPTTPNGPFKVVQGANVFVTAGNRQQMVSVSRNFIDYLYPSEVPSGTPSIPTFYAMLSEQQILMGPSPSHAFDIEIIGTIRPNQLSASNSQTYLTQYLPDLFFAAMMIFFSGYMKNFGAQGDDPQMAQSWEGQYNKLLGSANTEETRKRYNSTFDAPKGMN